MTSDQLVPGDVVSAIEALGLEILRFDGMEATCRCPAHITRVGKIDRNPSFQINTDTGLFICWSCKYSGNFTTLVRDMRGVDAVAATEWIKAQGTIGATIRNLNKLHERRDDRPRPLSIAALALFTAPTSEMLIERDLTLKAATDYGILRNPNTDAWILPMYDPSTGSLIGWQEKNGRKVRNYPAGNAKRNLTLFGIQLSTDELTVVVESPLDAARIGRWYPGALATYGSKVSREQIDLIATRSDHVVIFMDNDKAGLMATTSLIAGLRGRGQLVRVVTYDGLPFGCDPGDLTEWAIHEQILNAVLALKVRT